MLKMITSVKKMMIQWILPLERGGTCREWEAGQSEICGPQLFQLLLTAQTLHCTLLDCTSKQLQRDVQQPPNSYSLHKPILHKRTKCTNVAKCTKCTTAQPAHSLHSLLLTALLHALPTVHCLQLLHYPLHCPLPIGTAQWLHCIHYCCSAVCRLSYKINSKSLLHRAMRWTT